MLISAICGRFSSTEQVRFREFRALPPSGQWVCDESPSSLRVRLKNPCPQCYLWEIHIAQRFLAEGVVYRPVVGKCRNGTDVG